MSELKFNTAEEFDAAREAYIKNHPEFIEAKDVECLNLPMKKEYALQILRGTKPLEFRAYSDFYISRLIDKRVSDFIDSHMDDDEVLMFYNDIRQVKKIHFYNYAKTWYLDIECDFNDVFQLTRPDIEFLHSEYGVHDFDKDLEMFEQAGEEQRPFFFYFVCGKVLGTNLKV